MAVLPMLGCLSLSFACCAADEEQYDGRNMEDSDMHSEATGTTAEEDLRPVKVGLTHSCMSATALCLCTELCQRSTAPLGFAAAQAHIVVQWLDLKLECRNINNRS